MLECLHFRSDGLVLTAAVPDDQVPSLLQVDGQQEGLVKKAGILRHAGALALRVKLHTRTHTLI